MNFPHGISARTAFPPEQIRLLLLITIFVMITMDNFAQAIDSLEQSLQVTSGRKKILTHFKLADAYVNMDWEKSVGHARKSLELTNEYNDTNDTLLFESYYLLSKSYHGLGDYDTALFFGRQALNIAFDTLRQADILHHLGRIYEGRSEYQTALQSYLSALGKHKSADNKKGVANTLNSIAFVYKAMKQYEKAIDVLRDAKSLYEEIGNTGRVASVTFNIGLMTMEMDKFAEAIPFFRKAVAGMSEEQEPGKFSSYYNNLANCFQKLVHTDPRLYDSALYYGKKNLILKQRIKDYRGIANAHNGLAATYERGSDHNNAYRHSLAAFTIADSLRLKQMKKNALNYLITAEIALGKTEKLNDHFTAFSKLTEELNEESTSQTLSEMAVKYETEKKEAENKRLLLANAEQVRINWMLGGGGIILLGMLALVSYFYSGKRNANTRLKTQNKQIESNLREKEALLREIHHRVKNNLQVISSLLNMQSFYTNDPRMVTAIAEGQNRVKAMALIHQKLYQTEQLSEIDFQEYTEQLIGHLATAFGQSGKNIYSKVQGSQLKLDIDTAIPLGLILNELITNAYKYAFNDVNEGRVEIELTQDDADFYNLRISDSGRGLPPDFSEATLSSLGLKLVRMLTEQLDGSLTITNSPGASFRIRFKESRLSA